MRALLLIAGQSTRFWPLSDKNFFNICQKTILEHQIERLYKGGIKDVVLVGGEHNIEKAKTFFPNLSCIKQEKSELGMRGALLSALKHIPNEEFMVVGSNDIVEPSAYSSLITCFKKEKSDGVILAQRVERYFPGGYIKMKNGNIFSIIEKPGEGNEPSDLVNIVAHIHKNSEELLETLTNIKDVKQDDGYEKALNILFKKQKYSVVPYEGVWRPVKYPWHLLPLLRTLLQTTIQRKIHSTSIIHPSAIIDGDVIILEGSRVLPHATIIGPCVIGKNCTIATNTLVRESDVGDDSVIGFGSEIARSIIGKKSQTHLSYIGDSVVGNSVSFGGGSITGNLRLDEENISSCMKGEMISTQCKKFGVVVGDNVRLGIQSGTNPGVKIGADTFVRSGVILDKDVPEKSFVEMKNGKIVIVKNKKWNKVARI